MVKEEVLDSNLELIFIIFVSYILEKPKQRGTFSKHTFVMLKLGPSKQNNSLETKVFISWIFLRFVQQTISNKISLVYSTHDVVSTILARGSGTQFAPGKVSVTKSNESPSRYIGSIKRQIAFYDETFCQLHHRTEIDRSFTSSRSDLYRYGNVEKYHWHRMVGYWNGNVNKYKIRLLQFSDGVGKKR